MTKNVRMTVALGLILCLSMSGQTLAGFISFTFEGTASGSLDGTRFSDQPFTIVGNADTTNRQSFVNGFFIVHDSATITFVGFNGGPTVNTVITTATSTSINNNTQRAGFDNEMLFNGVISINDHALATYELLTPIGPMTGLGNIFQFGTPLNTTDGELLFDNNLNTTLTFQAIPEPSTLTLFGLGMLLLTRWGRARAIGN